MPLSRAFHPRLGATFVGVVCALGLCVACKSAEDYRADADLEVYEIVNQRRAELEAGGPFTIEPPPDALRFRILAGQYLDDNGDPPLMTLVDCLGIAAENSRTYQDRRESLYLVALDLTLQRWNFSWQETGSVGAFLDGDGNEAQTASGFSDFSLVKLFASGAQFVGTIGFDFTRNVASGDGWDAISDLSLSITQPLLRGFGSDIVLEPLTQAERNVVYEARAYERFRRTFAFDVASRYFRILELMDTLDNEEANYESLLDISEENEILAEAGRLNSIERDQASQDELDAQNRVVLSRQSLESALDSFNLFLGLPPETALLLDTNERERVGADESFDIEIDEQTAIDIGLRERLDFQTVLDRVDDSERDVVIAADNLRAGLDVGLSGSVVSPEGRPLDYRADDVNWTLSVDLDLPIDQLPERNSYRASLIGLDVSKRNAEESGDNIVADLRDALRGLDAARESYEIQTGSEALAVRRVESVKLNRDAGRSSTRDLLESQQALVRAQNNATTALTDYTLARLALYRDMELLRVDENGVSVETTPLSGP